MARKSKAATEREFVTKVQNRLDLAYLHDRDNRLDAAQDLRFLAGDQWPANVRAERETQNRPCLTLNRLPTFVNQVVNDFKMNPPSFKFVPADDSQDENLLEIRNGLVSQIQYKSNAINVFGNAFANAVSCGMGHFRIATGYVADDSFDQEILIKRIPYPLSVFWDPDAVEPSRCDAKWCVVSEMMTEAAFKEQYPDVPVSSIHMPVDEQFGVSRLYWRLNDLVRIAEYWELVPVTKTLAMFKDGSTADISDLNEEQLRYLPPISRKRTVETHEIRQWLVSGAGILDGGIDGNKWAGKYIPIIPVIGTEIPLEDKLIRLSLIRFARDPQQLYNYWQSAATEMMALQTKAPLMATPRQIAKFKGQWDSANVVTRPYLLYEPDPEAGGPPQRVPPPTAPAALVQQASIAIEDMKGITGIYDPSLGNRSNETSGVAIQARVHQGDVGTYHFMENFNASLVHAGRVIDDLIPKIYDSERAISLPREEHEDPKFARINQVQMAHDGTPMIANDVSQGKYDIRVKIGPSFATRRMEAVDSLMKLIQAFPQAAQVAGDLIVNLLDIPKAEELAERLKRMIPPQILGNDDQSPEQQQAAQAAQQKQQQQEQMQQQMLQLEMMLKQATAQKASSDAKKSDAEALLKQVEAIIAQRGAMSPEAPQAPSGPSQHQQTHGDYQATLQTLMMEEKLRRESTLADQAAARTQGAIIDNALKRAKFGEERNSGY